MLAETVDAVTGIDTHRDSHEVEIADAASKPIATMQVSNDSGGFARLLAAIGGVAPGPRADGDREALRILLAARQEITESCTAQAGRLRALLLAGDDTDRRAARTPLSGRALADRELAADASREQAVRQAEIARLALALGQAPRQLKDNHAQLLAIVDDIAPGLTTRFRAGPVSAAQAIVSFPTPAGAAARRRSPRWAAATQVTQDYGADWSNSRAASPGLQFTSVQRRPGRTGQCRQ